MKTETTKATVKERAKASRLRSRRARGRTLKPTDAKWLADYEAAAEHRRPRDVAPPPPALRSVKSPLDVPGVAKALEVIETVPPPPVDPMAFSDVPVVPPAVPDPEATAAPNPGAEVGGTTPSPLVAEPAAAPAAVPEAAHDAIAQATGFLVSMGWDAAKDVIAHFEKQGKAIPGAAAVFASPGAKAQYVAFFASNARLASVANPRVAAMFAGSGSPTTITIVGAATSIGALVWKAYLENQAKAPAPPPAEAARVSDPVQSQPAPAGDAFAWIAGDAKAAA